MFKVYTTISSNIKNCKTHCELYNHNENSCIFKGLNYDNPHTLKRCLNYSPKDTVNFSEQPIAMEKDSNFDFLFNLIGERDIEDTTTNYPLVPEIDFSQTIPNIHWYIAPEQAFGCWIMKHTNKPFAAIPSSRENAEQGWVDSIYRSPIPLHDHAASQNLKSRMCWFVDEDGWGQYTLIIANKIKFITYPKPPYYKK